jgi:hypothetical protein
MGPNITVTGSQGAIASHDFDDNMWLGGEGWLSAWAHVGASTIIKSQEPYQGERHVQMRGVNTNISRATNLSGYENVHLQFWAKTRSLEGNDKMYCSASPDGENWTVVQEWDGDDSLETYSFYDIDLSTVTMSEEFWIMFDSGMDAYNDYFYLDYLRIGGNAGYTIISTAGERMTTVTVEFIGETPVILSWEVE